VEIRERVVEERSSEQCQAPVIQVIPEQPLSHPLVVRLQRLLRGPKRNEKGFLVPRKGEAPHLLVTETTLPWKFPPVVHVADPNRLNIVSWQFLQPVITLRLFIVRQ